MGIMYIRWQNVSFKEATTSRRQQTCRPAFTQIMHACAHADADRNHARARTHRVASCCRQCRELAVSGATRPGQARALPDHQHWDGPAEIYLKRKNYRSLYGRILSNQHRHLYGVTLSYVLRSLYGETLSKLLRHLYGGILSHYVTWSHLVCGCPDCGMFGRSCSAHPGSFDCFRVLYLYLHAVLSNDCSIRVSC